MTLEDYRLAPVRTIFRKKTRLSDGMTASVIELATKMAYLTKNEGIVMQSFWTGETPDIDEPIEYVISRLEKNGMLVRR